LSETASALRAHQRGEAPLRVLFFVEGFTDIRFVVGLSRICQLTMAVPARTYAQSGLQQRVQESGAQLEVREIAGGRMTFQLRSLRYLLRHARQFDVILAQEFLRGALNANLAGRLRGVPVVSYLGIAPLEYFRCRRRRRQIGRLRAAAGEAVIRSLMYANGKLSALCLGMGPYLRDLAARHCRDARVGLYYGVDTELFRPATPEERSALRARHGLPRSAFLIVLSSRMSHEKDPETVIRATAIARSAGLNAVLLNLGGGYREFLDLARRMEGEAAGEWALARPAAHPMRELADYFRCADALALASLAEGAAFSTLEALACATPVVATATGGMAVQLNGYARLTEPQNTEAMAQELLWISRHQDEARRQALAGREYVVRRWDSRQAFAGLKEVLTEVARSKAKKNRRSVAQRANNSPNA
jgi:glycosyltransferase involved in cell wall biosynthesis